jgi:hypothetical protein
LHTFLIFIHDIPHRIAKKRHHPQEEAIHYACWLSLFTLHAIWPLVFLWAVSNQRTPLRVSLENTPENPDASTANLDIKDLKDRLDAIEATLQRKSS